MCQYRTVTTDEAPNTDQDAPAATALSRRRLLAWAVGGVGTALVAGAAGVELVSHGVLPGKQLLDQIDGACSVPATSLSFSAVGPSESGRFYSSARQRSVGYTIAYPSAHGPGDHLALVVMLHGFGNDHATSLFGVTPAQALALKFAGSPLTPMAMVTVDGGDGYWNPHPGDDPMAMVVSELIPLCQRRGLGGAPNKIAMMGISMGGYGALAIAQRGPGVGRGGDQSRHLDLVRPGARGQRRSLRVSVRLRRGRRDCARRLAAGHSRAHCVRSRRSVPPGRQGAGQRASRQRHLRILRGLSYPSVLPGARTTVVGLPLTSSNVTRVVGDGPITDGVRHRPGDVEVEVRVYPDGQPRISRLSFA